MSTPTLETRAKKTQKREGQRLAHVTHHTREENRDLAVDTRGRLYAESMVHVTM
jgi:hypothetical protein